MSQTRAISSRRRIIKLAPGNTPDDAKPKITLICRSREFQRHLSNVVLIITSSNATLLNQKDKFYHCCLCLKQFLSTKDLKDHAVRCQDLTPEELYPLLDDRKYISIKLDITDLKCKLCDEKFEDLDNFKQHLVATHNKKFYSNLNNSIVPYKFANGEMRCVVCAQEFTCFKLLMQHMHRHYGNHVCEVCGTTFVDMRKLQAHTYRHKTGSFKCSQCDKIFDTLNKKWCHERTVHSDKSDRHKCVLCGQYFSNHYLRNSHMSEVHGVEMVVFKCTKCVKTFNRKQSLLQHLRKAHNLPADNEAQAQPH